MWNPTSSLWLDLWVFCFIGSHLFSWQISYHFKSLSWCHTLVCMQGRAVHPRTPEHSRVILRKFQPQSNFPAPEQKFRIYFTFYGSFHQAPDVWHCENYNDETTWRWIESQKETEHCKVNTKLWKSQKMDNEYLNLAGCIKWLQKLQL